jgi:hypothetical protein
MGAEGGQRVLTASARNLHEIGQKAGVQRMVEVSVVIFARSASAVTCGNGRRHSGAANAVVGPPGTRSTTSKVDTRRTFPKVAAGQLRERSRASRLVVLSA